MLVLAHSSSLFLANANDFEEIESEEQVSNDVKLFGGSVWGSNPPETYSCPSTDLKSAEPTGTQPLPQCDIVSIKQIQARCKQTQLLDY